MASATSAERSRTRYAHALYRSALLRDPHPGRAGAAVVAAFAAQDWANVALDENSEARLIASLPPMPRWPVRRRAALEPLPASFWRLSAATRLALGLRLGRGFGTAQIALALKQPIATVGDVLIDGLAAVAELELPLTVECRAFRRARLDDPAAERAHALGCDHCRNQNQLWEAAETHLAEQLGRALGGLHLPPASQRMLIDHLNGSLPTPARWHRRSVWIATLIGVLSIGMLGLFWPRSPQRATSKTASQTPAADPQALLAQARSAYLRLPDGDQILHRQWAIGLERPWVTLQASEWVDLAQPTRHRMQLLDGSAVREWQLADGSGDLQYLSTVAASFCGRWPRTLETGSEQINVWALDDPAVHAVRQARWQSGPWAIGLRYLDLAAQATTLHSLGSAGTGKAATLTLSASGSSIVGTLLLRFDPATLELHEVSLLRPNNGRLETHTPWRLLQREQLAPSTANQQTIFAAYPSAQRPPLVPRTEPLIDHVCPPLSHEQALHLPAALPDLGGSLIGLDPPPAAVSEIMLVQSSAPPGWRIHVLYLSPGKRLSLRPRPNVPIDPATALRVGDWLIHIGEQFPGVLGGQMAPAAAYEIASAQPIVTAGVRFWAQGWSKAALLAALTTARPMDLVDWQAYTPLTHDPTIAQAQSITPSATVPLGPALHSSLVLHPPKPHPFSTLRLE